MQHWTVDQLDELMAHFDRGYEVNHDEAYRRFDQHRLLPPDDLPSDPFSPEYRERMLDLYKSISGKGQYHFTHEKAEFDVDHAVHRPYPYFTGSLTLAAQHFDLMGKLFSMMSDLKPGSRILECGFGWGNTTIALAALGYEVTALDVEEKYCRLVKKRTELAQVSTEIIHSDFLWVENADQQFDAVVFFECFHHCWDFERLLSALHRVVAPNGRIYFGAEPINDEFEMPWGVRLDGGAMFVARRYGWMELGYRRDYFAELLVKNGWIGQEIEHHFWVARRRSEPLVFLGSSPKLATMGGEKVGDTLQIVAAPGATADFYAVYGPYITLFAGKWRASINVDNVIWNSGHIVIDICVNGGTEVLAAQILPVENFDGSQFSCDFATVAQADQVEVRLLVPRHFQGKILSVAFESID